MKKAGSRSKITTDLLSISFLTMNGIEMIIQTLFWSEWFVTKHTFEYFPPGFIPGMVFGNMRVQRLFCCVCVWFITEWTFVPATQSKKKQGYKRPNTKRNIKKQTNCNLLTKNEVTKTVGDRGQKRGQISNYWISPGK